VIRALRRLFRRRRLPNPLAAPISDSLLLAVRRRRGGQAADERASTDIGSHRVSIREARDGEQVETKIVALTALLDELVPHLRQDERERLFEFVSENAGGDLDEHAFTLAHSLWTLRDRLREPLPELVPELTAPFIVVVDQLIAADNRSFWVLGWTSEDEDAASQLELVSPEGQRAKLLPGAFRFEREDVVESFSAAGVHRPEKHGFVRFVELPAPNVLSEGWIAELVVPAGARYQVPVPPVIRDMPEARQRILWELTVARPDTNTEPARREHAFRALERLQAKYAGGVEIESEVVHGLAPEEPDVSIVVPLWGRIDLLEHQLAQLWHDPEIAGSELIYVLDSPELAEPLNRLAADLHELYGLPFKVLTLSRNGGFATANNLAVSRARGRLLLLLNSDVLPIDVGWLGRLSSFYDATPDIGGLGPKLLYEDESIQHAGMYFKREAATRLWENQHYFKGFNRSLPGANVTRPVPAVTGACLMVERALYEELGGLSPLYVQGGYEDSDFCIRLAEHGRRNWYMADVELYHLEAQSFYIETRHVNPCNAWIQTRLWDERIEALMSSQPDAGDSRLVAVR
jgi:GT2 family glycosyltransferase